MSRPDGGLDIYRIGREDATTVEPPEGYRFGTVAWVAQTEMAVQLVLVGKHDLLWILDLPE